jgi:excisionase family DNA binding protein
VGKVKHLTEYKNPAVNTTAGDLYSHLHALVDFFVTEVTAPKAAQALTLREVLTAEELADRLKIPLGTVSAMARTGKLPGAFRVGKHWRFDLDLLRAGLSAVDKEP